MSLISICLLFLFVDIYPINCQDIEIEGVVRVGDQLIQHLKNIYVDKAIRSKTNEKRDSSTSTEMEAEEKAQIKNNIADSDRSSDTDNMNVDNSKVNEKKESMEDTDDSSRENRKRMALHLDTNNIGNKDKYIKNANVDGNEKQTFKKHPRFDKMKNSKQEKTPFKDFSDKNEDVDARRNGTDKYLKGKLSLANNNKVVDIDHNYAKSRLSNDNPRVQNFFDRIIHSEARNIDRIAERIQERLKVPESVLSSLIKSTIDSYTRKMKNYIAYITNQEASSEIDREYQLLDIVASSNMLLYSEGRMLLNTMIDKKVNNITPYGIESLTEIIYKDSVIHKKRQIFFICEELEICRAYPGISDYFAELISEILMLSDKHVETIVKIMSELIRNRTNFFKVFMKDNIADMIGEKLELLSKDLYNLKETFSVVRSVITQRFKLMKTADQDLNTKTKAVRIFIEIIDRTFSGVDGEELTIITFDTTLQAIRQWSQKKRDKIEIPLRLLLEHVVGVLRFNWDDNVRSEVAMLTEVMMTGTTDDRECFEELFSKGSTFVRSKVLNYLSPNGSVN